MSTVAYIHTYSIHMYSYRTHMVVESLDTDIHIYRTLYYHVKGGMCHTLKPQ